MGDNSNDLEMLRYAGKAVLMGNAEEELWESSFERTAGNNEDGVALALERFLGGC
jgi:hydroxymethylpyrimidine pyrophosphatase-like HAD family hydrolase